VDGVTFDAAIFTNLTRDHLDYHGTMEAYFSAKASLIERLSAKGTAIVNADAPEWRALPEAPNRMSFGVQAKADVMARDLSLNTRASEWTLVVGKESAHVSLPLTGSVNVHNALGAAAGAVAFGLGIQECAARLSTLPQIPGRLERISEVPVVLRDYAHTPDALERTLTTARQLTDGRIILVFGAGGERDRGKRPIMGEIAERLADVAIVTSDNPRTENPDTIIDEIEKGMHAGKHERITDRHDAIERALALADGTDIVVLAGKGHETYQIRGTETFPFDERQIVREITSVMRG
jgi:UDP-N-acetylmuramoyl-L-alanyl-D-glutamate--2,6-diaminopimelate ligase